MNRIGHFLLVCLLAPVTITRAADTFDAVKAKLAKSECVEIEFLSILESDIFDRTDTARGTAYLARDGRYLVALGDDRFLMTGTQLYSYSKANNQVIIQNVDSAQAVSSEVAYIRKLDEWFKSRILRPDREYALVRTEGTGGNIPDSMTVTIDPKQVRISRIAYFDVNDELVTLVFVKERHHDACDSSRFEPNFPKSVERVKM